MKEGVLIGGFANWSVLEIKKMRFRDVDNELIRHTPIYRQNRYFYK